MSPRWQQTATLAVLALLGAGLLALLQHLAAPTIEQQRQAAAERTLFDLLPAGSYDNHPLAQPIALEAGGLLGNPGAEPGYLATLNGQPSAVLLPVSAQGYEGAIHLLVAISTNGRLLGSKVLQQRETPGLGDLIERQRSPWLQGFTNKSLGDDSASWSLRADGGQFDQIAGATVTSRAVKDALQRALRFFDAQRVRLLGTDQP
ncbi:RnfABCDGE type electron transport complex subunit G [Aquipseudomonas ullengensis]|uniref:Ion-translocating oxidoreductase complex subunit G n=1 Tax=Aquipseudomonas ullengensis TaxID=2759166 RepID=A0A7W4LNR9_9GAMM|nr:RnfABCDGE type electron transport complex subunit G [Pseudomonas ullengensis]MBB2496555.1 RnfABCDGE type electron transport complex subunit G [Pseudomonas ullengensis]